jgi:DNA-nicking Smr family endonuclease
MHRMKSLKPDDLNRPFARLGELLARRSLRLARGPDRSAANARGAQALSPPDDAAEFAGAMAGVRPIDRGRIADPGPPLPPAAAPAAAPPDAEEIAALRALVRSGAGFAVSDTPEYMEGAACPAPPEITRRLHRGDFSIGGHLDLHGLTVSEARRAFDSFLREAVRAGTGAVLIIHGRGRSSPGEPVLKTRVAEWLSRGPWRKWVLAFASARLCDGGAGASYVLLRRRPIAIRRRRRRPPAHPPVR